MVSRRDAKARSWRGPDNLPSATIRSNKSALHGRTLLVRHLTLLLSLCLASSTTAGVVSRDLFDPGDGLLTYDDVNQREWLDFSVPTGITQAGLVLSESGPISGFRFATLEDVLDLAQSANVHWFDFDGSVLIDNTDSNPRLLALVDNTYLATGGLLGRIEAATGFVATSSGPEFAGSRFDGTIVYLARFGGDPIPGAINRSATGRTAPSESFSAATELPHWMPPNGGYWLYREAAPIPEPTAVCLALLASLSALRLRVPA